VRYGFIARHRTVWPTGLMCRVLRVSRSGFYEWLGRTPSRRARKDEQLLGLIRTSFALSDATYGSPRVWDDLTEWGERCSRKRVARLMREDRLHARAKRRRRIRSGSLTSPTSPLEKAGSIWRSSWICSVAERLAGR